jgi:hypothetical protein
MKRAILHANRNAANAFAVIGHEEIKSKVFDEEEAVVLQGHAVQGMKDGMTSAVGCCCAPICLTTFAKLQALTSKGTLVDFALWRTRERQAERFKLKNDLRSKTAHVLDCILIAKPI